MKSRVGSSIAWITLLDIGESDLEWHSLTHNDAELITIYDRKKLYSTGPRRKAFKMFVILTQEHLSQRLQLLRQTQKKQ